MTDQLVARNVIEALRRGVPPQRGAGLYSVGYDKLISGVQKYHLSDINSAGKIRFISGSWGSGKTHFFRLLREVVFKAGCLVSNVELNVTDASLNKFEKIFYSILRNVSTPTHYDMTLPNESAPFGEVVENTLRSIGMQGNIDKTADITYERFQEACNSLMANKGIDIDFKKMIQKYWETFLPESPEKAVVEQTREEILQWFAGEGTVGSYRKRFGVNKMISKDNAKVMLQSLGEFVKIAGYKGLVILFDEAEQSFSIMRRSTLRDAHNNLLSLINSIESLSGLFLIYATTPEFYTDSKYGIVIYGALSGRIGKPEDIPPKALDTIWNLDAIETQSEHYIEAAKKIRSLYLQAYPEEQSLFPTEKDIDSVVHDLQKMHPSLSAVRFWRVLVTSIVRKLDSALEGESVQTDKIYKDVMDQLKED